MDAKDLEDLLDEGLRIANDPTTVFHPSGLHAATVYNPGLIIMGAIKPSLYEVLKDAGVHIENHESDLYCPVTETSRRILAQYPDVIVKTFIDNIKGKMWYDVAFMFDPFWRAAPQKPEEP